MGAGADSPSPSIKKAFTVLVNFYVPRGDDYQSFHETGLDILGALPRVGDEIHIDDVQGVVSAVRWRIKDGKQVVAIMVDERALE